MPGSLVADASQVRESIHSILRELSPIAQSLPALGDELSLRSDLAFDSLSLVSLVFRVHDAHFTANGNDEARSQLSQMKTVGDLVRAVAQHVTPPDPRRPEDIAKLLIALRGDAVLAEASMMTFYRGAERTRHLTYGEFLAAINDRAQWLVERLKVRRGDRVALLSPNSPDLPLLILALMRIGAVSVPLNPNAAPSEWQYIVRHADVSGVLAAPSLVAAAREAVCRDDIFCAEVSAVPLAVGDLVEPGDAPLQDALATILYTSGTTGNPKGVGLTHGNLIHNALATAANFGLDRPTQLAVLPLYHAHAFVFGMMTALLSRGHLVFTEHFDPFSWREIVRTERVTVTSAFPTLLPLLLQASIRAADVPTLRCIMVASAPLSSAVAIRFEEETGIPLMHAWGLSEATCLATCMAPVQASEAHRRLMGDWDVPSVGKALDGMEVAVLGPDGEGVAPLERGELCVRGMTVMAGYFRDTAATAAAVRDGWLHSGDEGFYVLDEGVPHFFITGRIKEIIIRGGEKLSPVALEERIIAQAAELRSVFTILGFEHNLYGEEIGAYIQEDAQDSGRAQRFLHAQQVLPPEQRAKVIVSSPAPIPRTYTGKIQRRKLVHLFADYRERLGGPQLIKRQT